MRSAVALPNRLRSLGVGSESVATLTVGALAGLATGVIAAAEPRYALYVLGLLAAAAILARRPVSIAVAACVGVLLVQRIPIGSSISISDALLAAAAFISLPVAARFGTPKSITM